MWEWISGGEGRVPDDTSENLTTVFCPRSWNDAGDEKQAQVQRGRYVRPTAIRPRESCGSAVGSSQDHAWVHVWKAPLLSSASVQACPNHRCQCRVGQLILRCTYTSTNQWVSNPAQDRLGAWLCASYLTSLCPLPLSENQVTVRNKYVTCKTHQCLDVISGMLMLSAVTIIVTIYRGNAEIKAAERSQQRPKDSTQMVPSSHCGSLLWLKAFPYTVFSHLLYTGKRRLRRPM